MTIDSTLLAERELGELAEKIIIYRYKVYSASSVALIVIATILAIFIAVFLVVSISTILLLPAVFAAPFTVAAVLVKVFKKALRSLEFLITARGGRLSRMRLNIVAFLSYTAPFLLFYSTSPLPYWEQYAWYFALIVANICMAIYYERYINGLLPGLSVRVYWTWSTLSLLSAPLVVYTALTSPAEAWWIALVAYLFTSLISSIQEVYRAEKML